jgi:hypothetical protein
VSPAVKTWLVRTSVSCVVGLAAEGIMVETGVSPWRRDLIRGVVMAVSATAMGYGWSQRNEARS